MSVGNQQTHAEGLELETIRVQRGLLRTSNKTQSFVRNNKPHSVTLLETRVKLSVSSTSHHFQYNPLTGTKTDILPLDAPFSAVKSYFHHGQEDRGQSGHRTQPKA
jgi:hypothetical protein